MKKLKRLDLSACTTNEEVCKAVSSRVDSIPYKDLLAEVEKRFIYQEEAVNAIYTGLSSSINVFLSGPGGYGKSTLTQHILDLYNIPYTVLVGYKDMPVDALLGIPNMKKLLEESTYEINFKESNFCKPGVLIIEEFTDVLPSTVAALKTILSEKGFHSKEGKIESLISCLIIAANKSAKEVIDDESKRAFYIERFPLSVDVRWHSYTSKDYYRLLVLTFPDDDPKLLYFMSKLFEDNHSNYGNTLSPRIALEITKVYLKKGLAFISNFQINTSNLNDLQFIANREYNTKSATKVLDELVESVQNIPTIKSRMFASLYALRRIDEIKISEDIINAVLETKQMLERNITGKGLDVDMTEIDRQLQLLIDDKVSPNN